jgi:hypothetical protein
MSCPTGVVSTWPRDRRLSLRAAEGADEPKRVGMLCVGDDRAEDHHAMEIVDEHGVVLALIVERRDQPAFVALLREADAEFAYDAFKPALAAVYVLSLTLPRVGTCGAGISVGAQARTSSASKLVGRRGRTSTCSDPSRSGGGRGRLHPPHGPDAGSRRGVVRRRVPARAAVRGPS